jgi:hypothetical protein
MDNYDSSLDLHNDLTKQNINCCGSVRPNRKGMPDDFRSKTLELKQRDARGRTNGHMTAVVGRTNVTTRDDKYSCFTSGR